MRRQGERGACLGRLFLIFVSFALISGGIADIGGLWGNSKPTVMTLEQYIAEKPKAKWLTLENCELLLFEAVYQYSKKTDRITAVYIPLAVPGSDKPSGVILKSNDFNSAVMRIREIKNEEQFAAWMKSGGAQYFEPKQFTGWLTPTDSKTTALFSSGVVTSDPVTLKDGETKSWSTAIILLLLGILILVVTVLSFVKKEPKSN